MVRKQERLNMPESTRKVGRPTKSIVFPTTGDFGIVELAQNNPQISRVTLQLKVNQALENRTIKMSGLRKNHKGRPAKLFTRI